MDDQTQEELIALIKQAQAQVVRAIASTYTVEQLREALQIRQEMDEGSGRTTAARADMTGKIDPFDNGLACSIDPDSGCGDD